MNRTIAVEANLTPIRDYLAAQGCQVVELDSVRFKRVDAVVLSGGDENLAGMQDIVIDAPVINARGKTPHQVWEAINRE